MDGPKTVSYLGVQGNYPPRALKIDSIIPKLSETLRHGKARLSLSTVCLQAIHNFDYVNFETWIYVTC